MDILTNISVVIPLFNKVEYIRRALKSILAQSFQDFEIIVVDDGSTDSSAEVVREFKDSRIRLVHREHVNSAGGHAARNVGIREARYDLIAFLDADDEWLPDFLATIKNLAEIYPKCGAFATNRFSRRSEVSEVKIFPGIPLAPWNGVIQDYFRTFNGTSSVHSSAIAIKKGVFEKVGMFPESVAHGGDLDMWCRIAAEYQIAYDSAPHCIQHIGLRNSITSSYASDFVLIHLLETLGNISKDIQSKSGSYDSVNQYRGRIAIDAAMRLIRGGHLLQGREMLAVTRDTRKFRKQYRMWSILARIPRPVFNFLLHLRNW